MLIVIPQFVDRERELKYLRKLYEKREFSLVVIYGRRRLGKTALIKEFLKGKRDAMFC